jgi:hypothetical protein
MFFAAASCRAARFDSTSVVYSNRFRPEPVLRIFFLSRFNKAFSIGRLVVHQSKSRAQNTAGLSYVLRLIFIAWDMVHEKSWWMPSPCRIGVRD